VLCSVVKHAGSGSDRKKCSILYLFYCKETDNFAMHSAEFSNQTLLSKRVKNGVSRVLFSDKARYNKPIEHFKKN